MRDLPDWTRQVTIRYEGGFIGLEELAVRLGFPGTYNLQGNVVLMEDFESEDTEWLAACDALGSTAARSSRHKHSGDWAIKLYNVDELTAYARYYRSFYFPGMGKYAIFAWFGWAATCGKATLFAEFCNGTKESYIQVDYDEPLTTLSVKTTGWTDHSVDTALHLSTSEYCWYPILVTFDLTTGYYDKLYVADQEYDISDIPLDYENAGISPTGLLFVGTEQGDTAPFTVYVDDIIVLKNVP
jgi:hypothetical protein